MACSVNTGVLGGAFSFTTAYTTRCDDSLKKEIQNPVDAFHSVGVTDPSEGGCEEGMEREGQNEGSGQL